MARKKVLYLQLLAAPPFTTILACLKLFEEDEEKATTKQFTLEFPLVKCPRKCGKSIISLPAYSEGDLNMAGRLVEAIDTNEFNQVAFSELCKTVSQDPGLLTKALPFRVAASKGNIQAMEILFNNNLSHLETAPEIGAHTTALYEASATRNRSSKAALWLLGKGADINGSEGGRPLVAAAGSIKMELVRVLNEKGADYRLTGPSELDPLACFYQMMIDTDNIGKENLKSYRDNER